MGRVWLQCQAGLCALLVLLRRLLLLLLLLCACFARACVPYGWGCSSSVFFVLADASPRAVVTA
jgi:hypothetical protein